MEKKVLQDTIDRVVNRLMNLGGADYDDDKIASDEEAQSGKIARAMPASRNGTAAGRGYLRPDAFAARRRRCSPV